MSKTKMKRFCVMLAAVVAISIYPSTTFADEISQETAWKEVSKYTTTRVHLRENYSTDSKILHTLDRSEVVAFKSNNHGSDDWSLVVYGDTKGYIKSEFLDWEAPPEKSVELLDWSEVKQLFTKGVRTEIYDVRTGLVYYVKSFSNGNHADVEPVTEEDTAIMKRTYNNKWDWDGRPIWITIGDRTIAAAINGMPHGGGVNDSNGMNGQVCIHFKGSTVHNGNQKYARELQAVVLEAYDADK